MEGKKENKRNRGKTKNITLSKRVRNRADDEEEKMEGEQEKREGTERRK